MEFTSSTSALFYSLNLFYCVGSSGSVGSSRKGRKHRSAGTDGSSGKQRIQWGLRGSGDYVEIKIFYMSVLDKRSEVNKIIWNQLLGIKSVQIRFHCNLEISVG